MFVWRNHSGPWKAHGVKAGVASWHFVRGRVQSEDV